MIVFHICMFQVPTTQKQKKNAATIKAPNRKFSGSSVAEAYHLGEPLPALGVLLPEQVLLARAPPHNLSSPSHTEPLRRRLRIRKSTREEPNQQKKAANIPSQMTQSSQGASKSATKPCASLSCTPSFPPRRPRGAWRWPACAPAVTLRRGR
jgi:hypothetical protein